MPESQTTEWKQNWQDKYLEWICGFANAQGGTLIIGKGDNGNAVGVDRAEKLLEYLSNKIRQQLGLVCEVNLLEEAGKTLIEIITPPYSVPVSLRGHYFYRSGSTKTELTGQALNEFLLKKAGKTWDDIVEPGATLDDIDESAVKQFLMDAERAGRLPDVSNLSMPQILDKLRLTDKGQLKRAAIILFGKDPGAFYRNLFVKIGRFGETVVDMRFQEVSEGNLIFMLRDVMEQLEHKFLIKLIHFEGIHRIETLEYPREALRELLLNALVHRNYMGSMIQIRVHDQCLSIWNDGQLPNEVPLDKLLQVHISKPRNPVIAEVCYKAGYIDNWGRGIEKVLSACESADLAVPVFEEDCGGVLVTIPRKPAAIEAQLGRRLLEDSASEPTSGQPGTKSALSRHQVEILEKCRENSMLVELIAITGRTDRTKFRNQVLTPLLEAELVEMTIPDKPRSSKQQYRLTEKGQALLIQ